MIETKSKLPPITNLITKAALSTKAVVIKNKIPDTTGFIATRMKFGRKLKF